MKERPIIFSAPMVQAILDGRKTQTRRIVKPQPILAIMDHVGAEVLAACQCIGLSVDTPRWRWRGVFHLPWPRAICNWCQYGQPGDRLWVREAWQAIHVSIDHETGYGDNVEAAAKIPKDNGRGWWSVAYAATDKQADYDRADRGFPWRPAIHMPRWASRITLEITGVRVERVQDISENDALSEGADGPHPDSWHPDACEVGPPTYRIGFEGLWSEINGPDSWAANPWVWVVEFRAITPPPCS